MFVLSWVQVKAVFSLRDCLAFVTVFQMTLLKWGDKPQESYIALYFLIANGYAIFLTFISSEDLFRLPSLNLFFLNLLQPDVGLCACNSSTWKLR